ncbi:MAG: hypothetical protein KAT58_02765 [candidate division Zixibacteria bacterium]|nr:hypothetical protein [candidate division Zixibacteria bacterium]
MLRLYLVAGALSLAIGAYFWVRLDAGNDREKQIRAEITEQVVIEIREDQASDAEIDKKTNDALRNIALEWMRPTGPR